MGLAYIYCMKLRWHLFTTLLFLLLAGNQLQYGQGFTPDETIKHEEVINSSMLNDEDRSILRSFREILLDYQSEAFTNLFSKEFTDYLKDSQYYKDKALDESVLSNLGVALDRWETYFDDSIENGLKLVDIKNIIDLKYVGIEDFGGIGYRIFVKIQLGKKRFTGLRIFLHPSGPNGQLELHGSYG